MKKELLKGLNDEQIAKVLKCENSEAILALAKQEGIELNDEQLAAVNGGFCEPNGDSRHPNRCPKCESTNTKYVGEYDVGRTVWDEYECLNCGHNYKVIKCRY